MEIYFTMEGRTLVAAFVGELDEHSAESAKRKLDVALEQQTYNSFLLDLSRLSFMDSTGIGVIIGRYKQLKHKNCPMYVRNPSLTVDKIFRMSGLYEIIHKI